MSRHSSKVRFAAILLALACSSASADSIRAFSGNSEHRYVNAAVLLQHHAARITGYVPRLNSFAWADARPRPIPVRLLLPSDESPPPAHPTTAFERALDSALMVLERLIVPQQRKVISIYGGCKTNACSGKQ